MSVTMESLCIFPFVNVVLVCDICGNVSRGDGSQVVTLVDGRTICHGCLISLVKIQAEKG